MLVALVLAAGESTRMGSQKSLLPDPDGSPFVARVVKTLHAAGLADIVVVTGAAHAGIVAAVAHDTSAAVRFVRNPDPSRGQLSSLLVGMDAAVGPTTDGLLVTLVDVPLVRESTVRAVVDAWRASRAPIVRPAIGDRHGHPVIFDRQLFGELHDAPLDSGAKTVVRAHTARILNVPVDDEGCLVDVDTPEDYKALPDRARGAR